MGSVLSDTGEQATFSLQHELNIAIFNLMEVAGIHFTFRHKWLQMDLEYAKVLCYAIGWQIAQMFEHFTVIITDSRSKLNLPSHRQGRSSSGTT